jgi:hypothetical protein
MVSHFILHESKLLLWFGLTFVLCYLLASAVFTASTILKVSYAPFLLDLNLLKEIDEDDSRAVLRNGTLKISLAKKTVEPWG